MKSATASPGIEAFLRLVRRDGKPMPATLARHLLQLDFSPSDKRRMATLSRQNSEGLLTESKRAQLMGFVKCGHLLAALQSQARQSLRQTEAN